MSSAGEHSHFDISSPERYTAARRVTWVSVIVNLLLTVAQVIIGYLGNSQALVADGIHTLSDLLTDFMVLFALFHSKKAADAEHPYGHERIETATTLLLGVILFAVGAGIAVRAVLRLLETTALPTPDLMTLWIALFTLFAKEGLFRYLMRTANRLNSNMLRANAWHSRSDAISSLVVVAGIGGSLIGFAYLDAVAAIVVAIMIAKVAVELGWQALRELVDTGLDTKALDSIRQAILSVSGVKALHMLRTRRVGGQALADVHIIVDDHVSVSEGHQISEAVRARLIKEITPMADVMVHIDTEEDIQGPSCEGLPLRDEVQRRLDAYFRDIPEARRIEQVTLHYLDGQIEIELLLPLSVAADPGAVQSLAQQFTEAARADRQIRSVKVKYH